ncbi:hypothetical protein C8R43DRAFT_1020377 [Mycena crocata]|nr:hypothetical protein C8R43DRAFT_1020377 [Mycena crocata]
MLAVMPGLALVGVMSLSLFMKTPSTRLFGTLKSSLALQIFTRSVPGARSRTLCGRGSMIATANMDMSSFKALRMGTKTGTFPTNKCRTIRAASANGRGG